MWEFVETSNFVLALTLTTPNKVLNVSLVYVAETKAATISSPRNFYLFSFLFIFGFFKA